MEPFHAKTFPKTFDLNKALPAEPVDLGDLLSRRTSFMQTLPLPLHL